jgi:diguanylate cyclase (GGDEF)-like protein/PAS domain S-box-containing protein
MTARTSASEIASPAKERPVVALVLRLARTAGSLVAMAIVVSALNSQSIKVSGISIVWLSNGLLTGVLLCSPRRHWPAFLTLGFGIDFGVNHVLGSDWIASAVFASLNMFEVAVASALAYPAIAPNPDLTEPKQVRSFLLYCVFIAPAVTSLLAAIYLHDAFGSPLLASFSHWVVADIVGMATVVPLYLSLHHRRKFTPRSALEQFVLFALLGVVTIVCFSLTHLPTLWIVLFVLMLLGVRLGFTASAAGLLLVIFIGGYFSERGFGPLAFTSGAPVVTMIVLLQTFIAVSMLILYVTEVSMSRARRSQAELRASEARFRSLTETSRDIIVLADLDGTRKYVSPAVTELLGYSPSQLLGLPFNALVHPEDVPVVDQLFEDLLAQRSTSPVAYRARRADGSYFWVETTARLLRHHTTEHPEGFVCVKRDISDRKDAEQKLLDAFAAVEKLALVDGLTGVANRREFDRTLEREWQRAIREQAPISLILIDVDRFKLFNDLYGHLAGDECLRAIAQSASAAFHRTTDLLARYGGEEFVAILPSTLSKDAFILAERIRTGMEQAQLPHRGAESGIVTISLGVATMIPTIGDSSCTLIEAADAALYRAKVLGRNRSEVAILELASLQ